MLLTVISPYAAVLPLLYTAYKAIQNNCFVYKNPWNIGIFLLFVWSLFVGIINESALSSTASLVLLFYFFMGIFFQNYCYDEKKIERITKYLMIFSVGSGILAIVEKLTAVYYKYIWWGQLFGIPKQYINYDGYRIYSTFGNPNIAGTWFAVMILICLHFYDKYHSKKKFFAACI
jgi:hypothetical protein